MINKPFLSTSELAKISGMSRIAIFKKIQSGQIKARKQGRNYAIPAQEARILAPARSAAAGDFAIKKVVERAVKEYGETFKLLGKE